jgi:glutamate---cysteine ligase / carboxylate-amine ligase
MDLVFSQSAPLTLGVELELQLIDSKTFDLSPNSIELLKLIGNTQYIVPEVMQSMIEIKTDICKTAQEAELQLKNHLKLLKSASEKLGVSLACAGTHPTAKHWERKIFPLPRYSELIDRNQFISRRLVIFGLHVHIGVTSGDECIDLMNEFLYELPVLLALSASSPFWEGIDTGLASSRVTLFEAIPTGGHPCQMRNWEDFKNLIFALKTARSINSYKDIWWDLRPSPSFGTLEIRICDGMPTVQENMALVALIHCLAAFYMDEIREGRKREVLPDWIVRENKWRASRHGIDADLIVSTRGENISLIDYANKLLKILDKYICSYGYQDYKELILNSLKGYASYQRQKYIFEKTKDLTSVTKLLINELNGSI